MSESAHDHYLQALELWRTGRKQEAVAALARATAIEPTSVLYWANRASAHVDLQQWGEADTAVRRALELDPQRAASWYGLGNALAGRQRWREAAQAYEQALKLQPDLPNGEAAAATAWRHAGEAQQAANHYLRSIAGSRGREDPDLLTATAQTLAELGHVDEPMLLYQHVAQQLPGNAAAQSNLGMAYQAAARYDEAIECYRKALQIAPTLADCWSNLIVCLNYSPSHGPQHVLQAARDFDRHCAASPGFVPAHPNARDPDRRLRIGYVSPDLHRHAVSYFLLPLLERHSEQVESVCYYSAARADDWTARLKAAASGWVDCAHLGDEALAQRIRDDRIDIVVDLAGHTNGNRLRVFARRPAPVQVTWLGYVLTTGMRSIDWRVTYAATDPPGTEGDYAEKLWRLGMPMWGWRPLPGMPEPSAPPFLRKGCVTFAHLNRLSKVSRPALECWARILAQLPGSRLAIGLPPGKLRGEYAQFFEARGVSPARIDVYDKIPHERFWAMHGEIDIALDPFPFNGGTTSYETLWLGVPLVTCTGEGGGFAPRFSSRMGKALLQALDLGELVASDPDDYVRIAVALAQDPARMIRLRQALRARMAGSALLDEKRQAAALEDAYRGMWRQWCAAAPG